MGKPEGDADDFDLYETDGIHVYVRCDLATKDDKVTIQYSKFFFKESLTVQGILI